MVAELLVALGSPQQRKSRVYTRGLFLESSSPASVSSGCSDDRPTEELVQDLLMVMEDPGQDAATRRSAVDGLTRWLECTSV
jgi:hypothetical protein